MKYIYKYPLRMVNVQALELPVGAEILSVEEQHGHIMVWALVDPEQHKELHRIEIIGTGEDIMTDEKFTRKHLGTVQLAMGTLVFHVFKLL